MSENLLYPVKELFEKFQFNIPEYQRGYKWTADNVTKMLEDINKFEINGERYYCLQNITITQNDKQFDVIDGQQRLTTLIILLSYLGETEVIKDKLKYSIREVSDKFLNAYIIKEQVAHGYYDDSGKEKKFTNEFLNDDILKKYEYQDVFHFVQASDTIKKWLEKNNSDEFKRKLLSYVKLIVNNVGKSDNQEKIFANLNSNKVALTDVDLIRAILITRSMKHQIKPTPEDLVHINEHRVKLGWELDQFHIWWSDPSISKLFAALTNNKNASGIELLYLLFWQSEKPNQGLEEFRDELDKCSDENAIKNKYKDIRTFHHTMQDWYQDSEIYHYIGFLGAHNIVNINKLWILWEKENQLRTEFVKELKEKIFTNLLDKQDVDANENKLGDDEIELYDNIKNIKYPWYSENSSLSAKILVLMDIIQILAQEENKESRRLPVAYFTQSGGLDDIEHVFSQTPNNKTKYEDALKELECLKEMLDTSSIDDKNNLITDLNELFSALKNKEGSLAEEDYEKYCKFIEDCHFLHSIGNLLLLFASINKSYKNNEYIKKRNRIVEEAQTGKYIRPHTWTVFTKTFSGEGKNSDLSSWGINDIKAHAEYIEIQLKKHFEEVKNV